MRRRDRQITKMQDILDIIQQCEVLRLGLCRNNMPYIVPLNFGYELQDEKLRFYFHGATSGKKLELMEHNSNACFELDCFTQVLLAKDACKCTSNYKSVMGEGTVTRLMADDDKIAALNCFMLHCGYTDTPNYSAAMLGAVAVWQLDVSHICAKVHE